MAVETLSIADVLLSAVGFLIVYTLNGIKAEIKEVKTSMKELTNQLTDIDRRVVKVEARCSTHHHQRNDDDDASFQ